MIGFKQSLKQLLTVGRPREREVPPMKFRINRENQRTLRSNLNIKVEPLGVLVLAARHDQHLSILRMRNIAQSHFFEVSAQRLFGDSWLLPARSDCKHRRRQNRDVNSLLHSQNNSELNSCDPLQSR